MFFVYWFNWHCLAILFLQLLAPATLFGMLLLVLEPRYQARDTFRALDDNALNVDLRISTTDMGMAKNHPVIRPSDFVAAMDYHNRLDLLLPAADMDASRPILQEYWARFRTQFGDDHEVFQQVPPEALQYTIPCKVHGDEGRSNLSK